MIVRSEMMQYRARRFYYTNQGDYCYCYEKVWDTNYIHLDPDIRWSPKLCRWRGVNTGGQCLSSWPGANPSFTINGTDSRTSLGTFEVFDHDVRLGEEGLRVPEAMLQSVHGDVMLPKHNPLYYNLIQHWRGTKYFSVEPRVLRYGHISDGKLADQGWYNIECPPWSREVAHILYKPKTSPVELRRRAKAAKAAWEGFTEKNEEEGESDGDGDGDGGDGDSRQRRRRRR